MSTKTGELIGRFLRWSAHDPTFDVYLGLATMLLAIGLFGTEGSWLYLLGLPFGVVPIAGGVAEKVIDDQEAE